MKKTFKPKNEAPIELSDELVIDYKNFYHNHKLQSKSEIDTDATSCKVCLRDIK